MFQRWFAKPPGTFDHDLPSGLRLQVAPVEPRHAPRFAAGYLKLSEQSRRMRFFGQVSSLSSRQLEFLTRPDGHLHIAYAAVDRDAPDSPGVGVGRCIRLDGDSKIAELALTVLDDYQGRGAGLLLHASLHRAGYAAGLRQFLYDVAAENERYIRHLLALGARQVSRDRDVVRLMLPVCGQARAVPGRGRAARELGSLIETVAHAPPAPPLV